jgi:hypothetical protein
MEKHAARMGYRKLDGRAAVVDFGESTPTFAAKCPKSA